MVISRRLAAAVSAVLPLPLLLLGPVSTAASAAPAAGPLLPQVVAARQAGQWLAGQLTSQGFVPSTPGGNVASLSSTAQTILALSAANVDLPGAQQALGYLEGRVDGYVSVDGSDGPGKLALLILDAEALGANPTSFGGTNLVARLLATQQTSGADTGLFGTEAQVSDYSAGGYEQGLALAALAAAGVRNTSQVTAAISWLVGVNTGQCPNGGWTTPDNAENPCDGSPASYAGPDTNTTSVAVQGLAAQGALTPAVASRALAFLSAGQDSDAGWSYYPNTSTAPGSTDPDSTALVIQALVALGSNPSASPFAKGSSDPISALLSFQLTSGSSAGAFYYPPAPAPASEIATYQAVPALVGLAFPWAPSGHGYWEVASDGGIFTFGDSGFYGSTGGIVLAKPVVAIAATPDGRGYWEVASDGGIFSFGDAGFYGSTGGIALAKPVVGIAATPDGRGYWEVASDGGVFSFGDAGFYGSTGGIALAKPVVGIATTPDGHGYWEVASDGGIFTFGDANFYGSTGGIALAKPVVGITISPARPA